MTQFDISNDAIVLVLFIGVGFCAGLFLDVLEFMLLAVVPSLLVLASAQLAFRLETPWYVYPAGSAAQQAAYLVTLISLRPLADRVVVRLLTLLDR